MSEKQLRQNIDVQLDPDSDVLTRITGYDFRDALKRTTHLTNDERRDKVLTWIDYTHDRDIWRMMVLNNFDIESVMHEESFRDTRHRLGRDVYDAIHEAIPKRPKRTEKSKRNKLPKSYAVWSGVHHPEGRRVKINKNFDSWLEVRPIIFRVSGAQYIIVPPITRQDEQGVSTPYVLRKGGYAKPPLPASEIGVSRNF